MDSNAVLLRALGLDSPELELSRESFITQWRTFGFQVKTFQEAFGISGVNAGPLNRKVGHNVLYGNLIYGNISMRPNLYSSQLICDF